MNKYLLTVLLTFKVFISAGQSFILKDTSLNDKQYFGAFGLSVFGYNNDTRSYFSIYQQFGIEYNVTKSSKLGIGFSFLKFNWTSFNSNNISYDNLKYFSAVTDIQIFGRRILSRSKDVFDVYDKYIEYGIGYNCPYYFSLTKSYRNISTEETYPNNYNDIYFHTTFHISEPLKIPLGIKFEYHPFDIIRNDNYADMAKFRIDVLISLYSDNSDRKVNKGK